MKMNKLFTALVVLTLLVSVPSNNAMSRAEENSIVLSKDNTIILDDVMMGEVTGKVIAQATQLDAALSPKGMFKAKSSKPLYLFLNTPGGSIQAGLEMYEALNGIGRPVHTVTLFAASMGFQTVQNMGERLILKNGVLMSHRASGGFEGSFGGQFPSQIDSRYGLWIDRLNELDQQTVNRTKGKQTLASYQKQYASEMWLTGSKSVEQGYADKVVTAKCDETLSGANVHEVNFFGMKILYDTDACPLNTAITNVRVGMRNNKGAIVTYDEFLAAGGEFGTSCLAAAATNLAKVCAADPTLTPEKIEDIKSRFKEYRSNRVKQIGYADSLLFM